MVEEIKNKRGVHNVLLLFKKKRKRQQQKERKMTFDGHSTSSHGADLYYTVLLRSFFFAISELLFQDRKFGLDLCLCL